MKPAPLKVWADPASRMIARELLARTRHTEAESRDLATLVILSDASASFDVLLPGTIVWLASPNFSFDQVADLEAEGAVVFSATPAGERYLVSANEEVGEVLAHTLVAELGHTALTISSKAHRKLPEILRGAEHLRLKQAEEWKQFQREAESQGLHPTALRLILEQ